MENNDEDGADVGGLKLRMKEIACATQNSRCQLSFLVLICQLHFLGLKFFYALNEAECFRHDC